MDTTGKEKRQIENLSLSLMAGIFSFGICCLWVASFFLSRVFPYEHVTVIDGAMAALIYLLSCSVFYFISQLTADFFKDEKRLRVLVVCAIISVVTYEIFFFSVASLVAAALATVLILQYWNAFLAGYTQIVFYLGFVALLCGVGIAILAYLTNEAAFVFIQALPVLSVGLLCGTYRSFVKQWVFISRTESRSRYSLPKSSICTICTDGLLLGITMFYMTNANELGQIRYLLNAVLIVLLGFVLFFDYGGKSISEKNLLKSYLIRTVPFLLAMSLVQGIWISVCAFCLFVSLFVHLVQIISALTERTRFNQLSSFCIFGQGLSCLFLCFGAGWALCMGLAMTEMLPIVKSFAFDAVVLILIACHSFLFEDNYPYENAIDLVVTEVKDDDQVARPWCSTIDALGERYALSPRQLEVFELLARGRNCEYIKDEFCISKATAKAHIYSIYRKIDVHSQQELINLVDSSLSEQRGLKFPDADNEHH